MKQSARKSNKLKAGLEIIAKQMEQYKILSQDAQHIKEDRQLTAALIDRLKYCCPWAALYSPGVGMPRLNSSLVMAAAPIPVAASWKTSLYLLKQFFVNDCWVMVWNDEPLVTVLHAAPCATHFNKQRRFSLPTRKTRDYPLKGKVYCGGCDHTLRITQKKPFYMCRHSTADGNSRCRDVRADAAGLEEAVLLTLKK